VTVKVTVTETHVCDRCGTSQDKPFPAKGKVLITHDLHDWQGAAVAGARVEKDLCDECLTAVMECVENPPTPI
jgi:hypothetical protein